MEFYSIDPEARTMSVIAEPRTLAQASRIIGTAIGRWLLSGLDLPEWDATDGVSEQESAMQF